MWVRAADMRGVGGELDLRRRRAEGHIPEYCGMTGR